MFFGRHSTSISRVIKSTNPPSVFTPTASPVNTTGTEIRTTLLADTLEEANQLAFESYIDTDIALPDSLVVQEEDKSEGADVEEEEEVAATAQDIVAEASRIPAVMEAARPLFEKIKAKELQTMIIQEKMEKLQLGLMFLMQQDYMKLNGHQES